MQHLRIVTTSWDDGDKCDLKIAEFLQDRELRGTFYVPIEPYSSRPTLSHEDLRSMASAGFEIGAHGLSHRILPSLSGRELTREVAACKPVLEDILGSEVRMFCYPRGRFNSEAVRCVREAGYQGARTVRMLSTKLDFARFKMPTSVQGYPHPKSSYIKNLAKAGNVAGLVGLAARLHQVDDWVQLGKSLFDSVMQQGGIWHLYGHSWEIEKLHLWNSLARMLDYVSKQKNVIYIPNGEVLSYLPRREQLVLEEYSAS